MKTALFFILISLCRHEAFAQGIVHLEAKQANVIGSGFVVASIKDTLYIVTAGHVIKKGGYDIKATVNKKELSFIQVLNVFGDSKTEDIAILKGYLKGGCPISKMDTPVIGKGVFFFRGTEAVKLPIGEYGTIENWLDKDKQLYEIYLDGVTGGDSGSALFSDKGITGMIIGQTSYYVNVISIDHLKSMIVKWNSACWQL